MIPEQDYEYNMLDDLKKDMVREILNHKNSRVRNEAKNTAKLKNRPRTIQSFFEDLYRFIGY